MAFVLAKHVAFFMKQSPGSCFVLKADGLGDFVLASGAIRLLAREWGEEAIHLGVLPDVAPLALTEFPQARIHTLDLRERRHVLNLFVRNFLHLLPKWFFLLGHHYQAVASLLHTRNYLQSFLLAGLRSSQWAVVENQFAQKGGRRDGVETILWRGRGVRLLPYPTGPASWPLELLAHARIVERILGRPVEVEEILPMWSPRAPAGTEILLAPFSSSPMKDYPVEKWAQALRLWANATQEENTSPPRPLCLLGGPNQQGALQAAAGLLRERLAEFGSRIPRIEVIPPTTNAQLPVLLSRAGLILTVDTVFAHLACALDRPTVVAFSGLHRGVYAPWQRSARQVWLEAGPVAEGEVPRRKSDWHEGIAPATLAQKMRFVLSENRTA